MLFFFILKCVAVNVQFFEVDSVQYKFGLSTCSDFLVH